MIVNVCFVGLGSIAGRHIHNLKELLGEDVEIDAVRSGRGKKLSPELEENLSGIYYSPGEAKDRYDAVFITNPTGMHYDTLQSFLPKSDCFFIEKPVFQSGTEDLTPFRKENKIYYVACPLRYTNVIQYLKKNIDFSEVYSMRCISSSYLPDWRPGTDYRKTYSAHKAMGGGVSIDLIHEWDYIHYLTGSPEKVKSLILRKSDLEIDSDDLAIYIAEYADKAVELHLDYLGRKPIRKLELFMREDTICADLISQKIEWLCEGKVLDLAQERNDFQKKELMHFLDIISGRAECDNGLEEACSILRITKGN